MRKMIPEDVVCSSEWMNELSVHVLEPFVYPEIICPRPPKIARDKSILLFP
jgi:hypothetical protein